MEIFYIDGNIDYFECSDNASKQIYGAFIIGAENGPTEAIKDFFEVVKEDPNIKIITNCLEVLSVALSDIEKYDTVLYVLKEKDFFPFFDVYPELKNADNNLFNLYLSKILKNIKNN